MAAIVTNALATVEWQILRYPCRTPVYKLGARTSRFSRAFKRVRERYESTLNGQAHTPKATGATHRPGAELPSCRAATALQDLADFPAASFTREASWSAVVLYRFPLINTRPQPTGAIG